MKVSEQKKFKIFLTEQTVKELMYAVKSANDSGRPIGAIEVSSPYSENTFEITLGESESIGFRTSHELLHTIAESDSCGDTVSPELESEGGEPFFNG